MILHPYFAILFPVVSLFAHNAGEALLSEALTTCLALIAFMGFLQFVLTRFFKDAHRVGYGLSFFAFLFLTYGHLCNFILDIRFHIAGHEFGPNALLYPLFTIIFIGGVYGISKVKNTEALTAKLNKFTLILLIVACVPVAQYYLTAQKADTAHMKTGDGLEAGKGKPDIYYLMLDGYSRADRLKEIFGYDNEPFLDSLRSMGFQVFDQSTSNYSWTMLSMTATLNMNYLTDLSEILTPESSDQKPLKEMIKHNLVMSMLKDLGYGMVVVSCSGFSTPAEIQASKHIFDRSALSAFQNELLNITPIPALLRLFTQMGGFQYDVHRKNVLYALNALKELPEIDSPKFIYAHLFIPHAPFVFGPNGEPRTPEQKFSFRSELRGEAYFRAHNDQVTFLNKKIKEAVETILKNSKTPPVIIIHSDHGHRYGLNPKEIDNDDVILQNAFSNILAVYLPENMRGQGDPSMSLVNLFRFVFDQVFQAGLPLLENHCYFSTTSRPYHFRDVTQLVRNKA